MRIVMESLKAFVQGAIWRGGLREMTTAEQFRVFLLCRKLEVSAKKRKEEARDLLMPQIEAHGKPGEHGSAILFFEDGAAQRTKKVASAPSIEKVRELLTRVGVTPETVIVKKVVTEEVVDPSVLEILVTTGVLRREDVEACYPVSFAFNATENREAKKVLADV